MKVNGHDLRWQEVAALLGILLMIAMLGGHVYLTDYRLQQVEKQIEHLNEGAWK